jgi:predicted acetyltransferase
MSNDFTFRPATQEEMDALGTSVGYAFNEDSESDMGIKPEWTYCAFDGLKIAATSGVFPFKAHFNGQVLDNAAVTIVTTEPEYRRRGLVRKMMTDTLHRAHDAGQPIASLWASMGALYQRYGYGLASSFNMYAIDPRFSDFRDPLPTGGVVRRLSQDEARPLVKDLLAKAQKGQTLDNIRDDYYWKAIFPEKDKKVRHFAIYFDENGAPKGYADYRLKDVEQRDAGPGLQIQIRDFIWHNMDAYHGLWSYFRSHDLARELRFYYMPDDDPAAHLLLEPRMLNKKSSDGLWLRIVDVEETLKQRGYTQGGTVCVIVEADDLCPWNNGSWVVSAEGDGSGGRVSKAQPFATGLTLDPNTLASLLSGYTTASQLRRIGKIKCDDGAMVLQADRLFSTLQRPHCSMEF